jgi:uncharacterized membrane protein YfcA
MATTFLIVIILSLASLIQSISGFGFALVSAPILGLLIGPQNTIVILALASLIINLQLLITIKAKLPPHLLPSLILGSVIGLPIGLYVLLIAPQNVLLTAIGWITLCLTIATVALRPITKTTIIKSLGVGLVLGTLQSSVGVNGPILALYLAGLKLQPSVHRKTMATTFLIISLISIPLFISKNLISFQSLSITLLSIPGIFIATIIGNYIAIGLPVKYFRTLTYILIFSSTLLTLIR